MIQCREYVVMGVLRRIAKPFVEEVKRQLCWKGIGEHQFTVSTFGSFRFVCGNRTEYFRTVEYGGEQASLGAFLFLLRSDDVVWDVGASVGLFTVHAAAIAQRVVAFEPDPATFRRLRQNVAMNGIAHKTLCRQMALGNTKGIIDLQTDGLDGNAPSIVNLERHRGAITVSISTIDEMVAEGLPRPTVLKLDIEGAEHLALQGAHQLLRSKGRPRILFVEIHPKFLKNFSATTDDVEGAIRARGYRVLGVRERDEQYHLIALAES